MSLLYKRPGSPFWYVAKTRESTRTKNRKDAEEFARKSLTEHWRESALGEMTRTWADLAEEWIDAKDGRPSAGQDRMVIDRMAELLARREIRALTDVSADVVAQYAKEVKAESSASTANRHLTTVRAMLRRAATKGWIDRVPRIEAYQLTKAEPRWLTMEQFNAIAEHLPEWVADMAVMAVQTGMRYSNVAGLRWEWISRDGNVVTVPAVYTKTGRTYTVPLSAAAKKILAKRLAVRSQSPALAPYVFVGKKLPSRGNFHAPVVVDVAPVPSVRHWWEIARDKAGFPDVRWHDLRHTWASLHVQNGTPDRFLAQMGGWASTKMLENYAHLSTAHLEAYADNVNNT